MFLPPIGVLRGYRYTQINSKGVALWLTTWLNGLYWPVRAVNELVGPFAPITSTTQICAKLLADSVIKPIADIAPKKAGISGLSVPDLMRYISRWINNDCSFQ